jgi:succinyl-CoA synthetase beta subunit
VAGVKIQEADAKSLLLAQGLPVPPWEVARTAEEVEAAAQRFLDAGAGRVVVKAQVLVGGRGKAGGVKLASTAQEASEVGSRILGMDIKGITVRKVLVGAAAEIVKEFYLGAIIDRAAWRSRKWPGRARAPFTASPPILCSVCSLSRLGAWAWPSACAIPC